MISCISHFPLLILHYYSGFRRNARVLNPASLFSLLFFPRSVTNRSLVSTAHACGVIAKHMAKQDGGRSPKAGVWLACLLADMGQTTCKLALCSRQTHPKRCRALIIGWYTSEPCRDSGTKWSIGLLAPKCIHKHASSSVYTWSSRIPVRAMKHLGPWHES